MNKVPTYSRTVTNINNAIKPPQSISGPQPRTVKLTSAKALDIGAGFSAYQPSNVKCSRCAKWTNKIKPGALNCQKCEEDT